MIDTHCHLFDPPLEPQTALTHAKAAGVKGVVVVCTHFSSFDTLLGGREAVRQLLPEVWFTLGVHPWFVEELSNGWEAVLEQALPRVDALGEVGLDRGNRAPDLALQLPPFHVQLELAKSLKKPVLLHVVRAHDLVLECVKGEPSLRGILHAFSGSPAQATQYVDRGWYLGIGGGIARENAHRLRRVVKKLPLSALVLETDSPYMWTPSSPAGASRPGDLLPIAQTLAVLKGVELEEVIQTTTLNARSVFQ